MAVKLIRSFAISLPMALIGGGATAAQVALSNPPVAFPTDIDWLWSSPNPWLLITSAFSGLGAVSAIYTFFQPAPYAVQQGRDDRKHGNASFKKLDERNDERRDEVLKAIERDKHEQAIADLQAGNGGELLRRRYFQALGIKREDGTKVTEREAAEFALAAQSAAQSENPRIRDIAALIDAGKIVEASDKKAEIAEETLATAARELRDAARLALPVSPSRAMEHFKRATEIDPNNLDSWVQLGRLRIHYETLAGAELAFKNGVQQVDNELERMVLHHEMGILQMKRGKWREAKSVFEHSLKTGEDLLSRDPDSIVLQENIAIAHDDLGGVGIAMDQLDTAKHHFEKSLATREALTRSVANSVSIRHQNWISQNKVGEIDLRSGDLPSALEHFQAGLAIVQELVEEMPVNIEFLRDLSISNLLIGQVEMDSGNPQRARPHLEKSLSVSIDLADKEPNNGEWQRDLSINHNKLGDLEQEVENLQAARTHFETSTRIADELANKEPENAQWQADLSISHYRLANIEKLMGDLPNSRLNFEKGLVVSEALAAMEPKTAQRQREILVGYWSLARLNHPDFPWSRVLAKLEAMVETGTLLPADRHLVLEARRFAAAEGGTAATNDS